jgi:hypothetical protein
VHACAAAAALFLSPAAASPSAESSRGEAGWWRVPQTASISPVARQHSPARSQSPACSRSRPGSRFPGSPSSWLCTPLGAFAPGVASDLGLPSSSVTARFRGSPCSLAAVSWGPSPEGSALTAAFALAERSAPVPRGPPAAARVAAPAFLPGAGRRGSRELAPSPRPPKFASLLFRGGGSAPWGGWSLGP